MEVLYLKVKEMYFSLDRVSVGSVKERNIWEAENPFSSDLKYRRAIARKGHLVELDYSLNILFS